MHIFPTLTEFFNIPSIHTCQNACIISISSNFFIILWVVHELCPCVLFLFSADFAKLPPIHTFENIPRLMLTQNKQSLHSCIICINLNYFFRVLHELIWPQYTPIHTSQIISTITRPKPKAKCTHCLHFMPGECFHNFKNLDALADLVKIPPCQISQTITTLVQVLSLEDYYSNTLHETSTAGYVDPDRREEDQQQERGQGKKRQKKIKSNPMKKTKRQNRMTVALRFDQRRILRWFRLWTNYFRNREVSLDPTLALGARDQIQTRQIQSDPWPVSASEGPFLGPGGWIGNLVPSRCCELLVQIVIRLANGLADCREPIYQLCLGGVLQLCTLTLNTWFVNACVGLVFFSCSLSGLALLDRVPDESHAKGPSAGDVCSVLTTSQPTRRFSCMSNQMWHRMGFPNMTLAARKTKHLFCRKPTCYKLKLVRLGGFCVVGICRGNLLVSSLLRCVAINSCGWYFTLLEAFRGGVMKCGRVSLWRDRRLRGGLGGLGHWEQKTWVGCNGNSDELLLLANTSASQGPSGSKSKHDIGVKRQDAEEEDGPRSSSRERGIFHTDRQVSLDGVGRLRIIITCKHCGSILKSYRKRAGEISSSGHGSHGGGGLVTYFGHEGNCPVREGKGLYTHWENFGCWPTCGAAPLALLKNTQCFPKYCICKKPWTAFFFFVFLQAKIIRIGGIKYDQIHNYLINLFSKIHFKNHGKACKEDQNPQNPQHRLLSYFCCEGKTYFAGFQILWSISDLADKWHIPICMLWIYRYKMKLRFILSHQTISWYLAEIQLQKVQNLSNVTVGTILVTSISAIKSTKGNFVLFRAFSFQFLLKLICEFSRDRQRFQNSRAVAKACCPAYFMHEFSEPMNFFGSWIHKAPGEICQLLLCCFAPEPPVLLTDCRIPLGTLRWRERIQHGPYRSSTATALRTGPRCDSGRSPSPH
ncbi:hypothetical protein VP01_410g3 [Puccinia sorghi]|uniref:Uncharacterized protein n=1 Tax=Puccinia sorghi TaxID=27349 RepID=A0A0L6US27_9BASI|nr:hypothetical protein VP01_410g3 [Puccinia sorghi]